MRVSSSTFDPEQYAERLQGKAAELAACLERRDMSGAFSVIGNINAVREESIYYGLGLLARGLHTAIVTFEVDEIDRRTRTGWSVLVRGLAEELSSAHRAELIERTTHSGVKPWAPGEHERWLRIIPQGISGRRIVPAELPPPFGQSAYL
jgi:hypothetical protein